MRFAFVEAEKAVYPVKLLCQALEVSGTGFTPGSNGYLSPAEFERAQHTEQMAA